MKKPNLVAFTMIVLITLTSASFAYAAYSKAKLDAANTKISGLNDEITSLKSGIYDESNIDKSAYQGIFLTNGSVYFGKIENLNEKFIKIRDVYYLNDDQESLVKLGNEIHGPQDTMFIERTQILFWENLKKSGEITKAINNYRQ